MQFVDYPTGLYLDSTNTNSGTIDIIDCTFLGCTGYGLHHDCQSSVTNVQDCIFRANVHDIYNEEGDQFVINGGWFQREGGQLTADYDAAIINTGNCMYLNYCCMVPQPEGNALEAAWIKNYRNLYCDGVRFGNEASGITPINNFPQNANGTQDPKYCVTMTNCYKTGTGGTAAIRLFGIPNLLVIEDCEGFGDSGASLIEWSSSMDTAAQDAEIASARGGSHDGRYTIFRLSTVNHVGIPTNLEEFASGYRYDRYAAYTGDIVIRYEYNNFTVPSGNNFFRHQAVSYDGSVNADGIRAEYGARCVASAGGTEMYFATTANGSPTLDELLLLKANKAVNFVPRTAPASPAAGDVYYDSGTNKLRCYNGTIWNDLF